MKATPEQIEAALIARATEIAEDMLKKTEGHPEEQARIRERLRLYVENKGRPLKDA